MYRLSGNKRAKLHNRIDCRAIKGRKVTACDAADMQVSGLCKYCNKKMCFSCGDIAALDTPCGIHSLCAECLDTYVEAFRPTHENHLPCCPCGAGSSFQFDRLPDSFQLKISSLKNENDSELNFILSNILTKRCPHCNFVFADFDACAAVFCDCGKWFCGLCLQMCFNREDAHYHVMHCKYNPCSSYFVPSHIILETEQNVKVDKTVCFLQGRSVLKRIFLLFALRKFSGMKFVYDVGKKLFLI